MGEKSEAMHCGKTKIPSLGLSSLELERIARTSMTLSITDMMAMIHRCEDQGNRQRYNIVQYLQVQKLKPSRTTV